MRVKRNAMTALAALVLASVALGIIGYGGWLFLIKDRVIGCTIDLGTATFETPDIGQKKYCPDITKAANAAPARLSQ